MGGDKKLSTQNFTQFFSIATEKIGETSGETDCRPARVAYFYFSDNVFIFGFVFFPILERPTGQLPFPVCQ